MSSLRELQAGFRAALLGQGDADIVLNVVPDGLSASARVAVYRHHVRRSLTDALASTFPVVCRLVDRRFFGWLADCYVRQHAPTGPCLFEYGADLPAFVARFPACAALPWLPDVARLEWAMNVALHAPHVPAVDPSIWRSLDPTTLACLTLRFDPSVTLLESAWPVDAIWRANQPGVDGAVDLDSGTVRLEVRRVDDDVVFRPMTPATFVFRSLLAAGQPLAGAADGAFAADARFDLAREIRALLDENLLAA